MPPPDVLDQLREARVAAPQELRERVRLIAARATAPPRRRIGLRRAALVLVPVLAACVAAAVVLSHRTPGTGSTRGLPAGSTVESSPTPAAPADRSAAPQPFTGAAAAAPAAAAASKAAPLLPGPTPGRVQRYEATLGLRLRTPAAVSAAARRALRIAGGLGGYARSIQVDAGGASGYADLVLRIPRANVDDAVQRLGALGTVTSENVQAQDLQAQVNATGRLIARLEKRVGALRSQLAGEQARDERDRTERAIAAFTARIERLQRGRAGTIRTARYATIDLTLSTPQPQPAKPHHHGPLHGLVAAFRWIGIGLVYALAIAAPFVVVGVLVWLVVRTVRRRREDELLSRP